MTDLAYLDYLESQFLTENRKARFLEVLAKRTNHFTIALEDVFQLHNTSAVMRTCEVFGIQQVHVVEQKYGKKVDKEIAMGAQKWVDLERHENITACIAQLKDKGYQIIATTPHEKDCLLEDFDITRKSAFFFGTESLGLSEEVLGKADGFLKIPMSGFTESLNISVAASIIVHDLMRRLHRSEVSWQLSESEKLQKRLDWARHSVKDIAGVEARYYANVNR